MKLDALEQGRLLLSMLALLIAAHACGYAFARIRQPRVMGEILGGLLLGPTVLGYLAPALQEGLFHTGATPAVLAAVVQFGLQLVMFTSGLELRAGLGTEGRRTVALIAVVGTVIPFGIGLALTRVMDLAPLAGEASHPVALALVVAIATAVTSIPVISRILLDLGLMQTRFARIVLGAAVLEDLALYVTLAIALGLVARGDEVIGLPAMLGLGGPSTPWRSAYYVAATVTFFVACLVGGPRAYHAFAGSRLDLLWRASPIAALLAFMLACTALALSLGVAPMFGAFLAGVIVASPGPRPDAAREEETGKARESIRSFSIAFFVPIYFASVGLRLNLRQDVALGFSVAFITVACVAKFGSVLLGARLAGEAPRDAYNLAVAMNARGGPGIVLATVARDAGIIGGALFVTLVVLALGTSSAAGWWLEREVRSGRRIA